jgi:ferredoxin/flavodoxin
MTKNIIFYFTGTGNSLKVAKDIANEIGNCKIISMGKTRQYNLSEKYDSIGFIYPTYYRGLPKKVNEFISDLNFKQNENAYYYAVATCGGRAGNALSQINDLLLTKHNVKLNYGQELQMFANYIIMYNMSKEVNEIKKESNEKLVPIMTAIKNKENNSIKKSKKVYYLFYNAWVKNVSTMDKNYNVNDNCTGCGICGKVCPVGNIEIVNNKPQFNNNCEQCLACIQYCPQKAINYKHATQNRRRYTHPDITINEIINGNT